MKKIIRLTESDLENIVKKVIEEQSEERKYNRAVQKFLNYKKITGNNGKPLVVDGRSSLDLSSQTAQAIAKYQQMLGVDADGQWGRETFEKMEQKFPKDEKKLRDFMAEEGGLGDQIMRWLGLI